MIENDFHEQLVDGYVKMTYAVIYARYSCDRQNEQSIDGQIRVCQEYAARNNIKIVGIYVDRAMTGTNDNRADFQRMLKDSDKKEWQYVLVYKLDRFSRNKYEMAIHRKHLKDNGVKILSAMENIPDTPEGILLESLLEGMNQYYSEELSQKTKRGMNEMRLKGNFIGGIVNYGYSLNPIYEQVNGKQVLSATKVIVNEEEAAVVKELFTEYANGKKIVDIAASLNARGVRNRGEPFLRTTLYNMLRQEKYTGIYRINGMTYNQIYPPIITAELYDLAKVKLEANKHGKHSKHTNAPYLLKGKIYCGCCGRRMSSGTGTSKSGKISRYYLCPKTEACEQRRSLRKEVLEAAIMEALEKVFHQEKNYELLIQTTLGHYNENLNDMTTLIVAEKELAKTERSLSNLVAAIEAGMLTDTTKQRLEELEQIKKELKQVVAAEKSKEKKVITREQIEQYISYAFSQPTQAKIELLVQKVIITHDNVDVFIRCAKDMPPDEKVKRRSQYMMQNPDWKNSDRGSVFMTFDFTYETSPKGRKSIVPVEKHGTTISLSIQVFI